MDIGKLTTGVSIKPKQTHNNKEYSNKLEMKKDEVENAVKSWNTAKADVKISSLATIYDKADQIQVIKDILTGAGIELNDSNIAMLESMIDAGLSLDLPTLQKMKQQTQIFNMLDNIENPTKNTQESSNNIESQLAKTDESKANLDKTHANNLTETKNIVQLDAKEHTANFDKAVFTLKNSLPINQGTSQLTNKFANAELNLSQAFDAIATDIANIDNPVLKQTIVENLVAEPISGTQDIAFQDQTQKLSTVEDKVDTKSLNQWAVSENVSTNIATENLAQTDIAKLLKETYQLDISNPQEATKETIDSTLNKLSQNIKNLTEFLANITSQNQPISDSNIDEGMASKTVVTEENQTPQGEKTGGQINQDSNQDSNQKISQNQLISSHDPQQTERVLGGLRQIHQTINFSQSLQNAIYIPLPLVVQDQQINGELYVFKDGKNNNKNAKKATSALIGLDTLGLGRIETYIQKTGDNISIQFRLGEETTKIVKQSISQLTDTLKISNISYLPMDKPFEPIQVATLGAIDLHKGFSQFV